MWEIRQSCGRWVLTVWSRYNQHRTRNWSFDTKALAEAKFDSLPVDYDDWR